jgi:NAD(P)-dependent dehydrogenase (short-subunit alcohol dehydrogenase family)
MTNQNCCIIFGASGGLGQSLVSAISSETEQRVIAVARTKSENSNIDYWCDNRDLGAITNLFSIIENSHGEISSVLDFSGVSQRSYFSKLSEHEIQEIIQTNIIGPINLAHGLANRRKSDNYAKLILVSSVVTKYPVSGANVYAASKGAIESFVEASSKELLRNNVIINAVRLGYFDKGMIKDVPEVLLESSISRSSVGRIGSTSDLLPLVKFFMNDSTEFLTGTTISLTGGG